MALPVSYTHLSFFEIGMDKSLFDGLYISGNTVLCEEHMGKHPLIFLSFKGVDGLDFTTARRMLCAILKDELDRHYYLKTSDVLTDEDRILSVSYTHLAKLYTPQSWYILCLPGILIYLGYGMLNVIMTISVSYTHLNPIDFSNVLQHGLPPLRACLAQHLKHRLIFRE